MILHLCPQQREVTRGDIHRLPLPPPPPPTCIPVSVCATCLLVPIAEGYFLSKRMQSHDPHINMFINKEMSKIIEPV
jgi:hypothetical protein